MAIPKDFEETTLLVRSAQAGDPRALHEVVERYYPRVRRYVTLRLGRASHGLGDLDDVVQNTMMTALKGLDRFEHRSEGSFSRWIAHVATCAVVDHQRKARAGSRDVQKEVRIGSAEEGDLSASAIIQGGPSPSEIIDARRLEAQLQVAFEALSERDRQVILLRRVLNNTFEEIAAELSLESASAARTVLSRALVRLSGELQIP